MRVLLGKFAKIGIEDHHGPDLGAGIRAALAHYTHRLKSGLAPIGPPSFLRSPGDGGDGHWMDLPLEQETEAMLAREAERHRVSVDAILSHAVLIYLAAIDCDIESIVGVSPATSSSY